ncbi:MAG: DMT family transporter [Elusimicrobiota bacterium]
MQPLTALLLDTALTALWPLIGKAGLAHYSGCLFAAAGLLIGLAVMSPWMLQEGRWRLVISREVAPTLFAMGLFSGVATVIYISAMAYTTPANGSIMAQIEVLYSAGLCAYFLGEALSLQQSLASLLVVAGTGLIMFHDLSSPRWKGDLMILATPWMYQASHIFSKRLPKGIDPITVSGGRVFYGIIALTPFCLWDLAHGARWSWSAPALAILLAQGVGMSSINFILWYKAILRMDLAKATAIILAYPALTVLFSWALGQETIQPVQLLGLVVTLSGALWMSKLVLAAQKKAHGEAPVLPGETAAEI